MIRADRTCCRPFPSGRSLLTRHPSFKRSARKSSLFSATVEFYTPAFSGSGEHLYPSHERISKMALRFRFVTDSTPISRFEGSCRSVCRKQYQLPAHKLLRSSARFHQAPGREETTDVTRREVDNEYSPFHHPQSSGSIA